MKSFYEGFQQDDAELIESLSRVVYELRENRKSLLEQYEATDEREILDKLTSGVISEHPSYEHYLSSSIMAEMHETVRGELGILLQQVMTV